jgi:hypothetical protein
LNVRLEISKILMSELEVTTAMNLPLTSIKMASPSYSVIGKTCFTSPV